MIRATAADGMNACQSSPMTRAMPSSATTAATARTV